MQDARVRRQAPSLLARLFCFAPRARVGEQPRRASRSNNALGKHARADGKAAQTGPWEPAGAAEAAPGTPGSAAALTAYLGSRPLDPDTPLCHASAGTSILQASSYVSSFLGSGSGASGASGASGGEQVDEGYDADSDCPPSDFSPRRFRPALRHHSDADQASSGTAKAAPGEAEGDEEADGTGGSSRGVSGIILSFERLSVSSSAGGSSSRARTELAGAAAAAAAAAEGAGAGSGSRSPSAAAEGGSLSPLADSQPGSSSSARAARAHGLSPLTAGSAQSRGSSISLYHFLGGSRSRRGSRRGNGVGGSSSRRSAASLQLPVPDTPASTASVSGGVGGPHAGTAARTASGGGMAVVAATAPPGEQVAQAQQPEAGRVQRRLTEIQNGHFISLEKLRRQCGNFEEPPGDLLTLMARRVFANRSSLLQRLCSEGLLSDLQAEDSKLHTPSLGTVTSPRSPPPPEQHPAPPKPAAVAAPQQAAAAVPQLPQLPRIRTRVGMPQ